MMTDDDRFGHLARRRIVVARRTVLVFLPDVLWPAASLLRRRGGRRGAPSLVMLLWFVEQSSMRY